MEAFQEQLNAILLNPAYHDLLTLLKATRNGAVYGAKIRFPHALVMTVLFRTGTPQQKALAIFKATRQHARNLAIFAFLYKAMMLVFRGVSTNALPRSLTSGRGTADMPRAGEVERKVTGRESSADSFLAGMIAGYVVFGRKEGAASAVAQQIVIYVFARSVLGLAKLAVMPRKPRHSAVTAGYGDVRPPGGGLLDVIFGDPSTGRGGLVPGVWSDDKRELWKALVHDNSWALFASISWGTVMWLFRWHPDVLQPSLRSSMVYLYDNAEQWDGVKNWIWHNK